MRTTININNDLLKRIQNTSDILGISTDDLIVMLIKKVISKNTFDIQTFKGIRYQDADPEKNWGKLHVTLGPQLYESDLDLKKCFKLSFSFIISFAIIHFLNELIATLTNSKDKWLDNYPPSYIFIAKDFSGIQGFIILWGIPEEKHLKEIIP